MKEGRKKCLQTKLDFGGLVVLVGGQEEGNGRVRAHAASQSGGAWKKIKADKKGTFLWEGQRQVFWQTFQAMAMCR